jgi:hypothetical protein
MMPNGKPFGECTYGEIGEFGEQLKRIGAKGAPDDTVKIRGLTPSEIALIITMRRLGYAFGPNSP